jgi:hypothetical protein
MALVEDLFKGNIWTGLAIGVGAIIVAPVVVPALTRLTRPLAKATIKTGFVLYDKGRETAAELGEVVEDIVAEARAEFEQERPAGAGEKVAATEAAPAGRRPRRRKPA